MRRQPFGGWKRSSVGPGAKAGGPNYLTQFSRWNETSLPQRQAEPSPEALALAGDDPRLLAAARSYAYWWREEFSQEHDPSNLLGESNHFRYKVAPEVVITDPHPLQHIAAATVGIHIVSRSKDPLAKVIESPPLANGRLELLNYLHEQGISETTHRHGRVS